MLKTNTNIITDPDSLGLLPTIPKEAPLEYLIYAAEESGNNKEKAFLDLSR